mgnify:CR=1 FL=1
MLFRSCKYLSIQELSLPQNFIDDAQYSTTIKSHEDDPRLCSPLQRHVSGGAASVVRVDTESSLRPLGRGCFVDLSHHHDATGRLVGSCRYSALWSPPYHERTLPMLLDAPRTTLMKERYPRQSLEVRIQHWLYRVHRRNPRAKIPLEASNSKHSSTRTRSSRCKRRNQSGRYALARYAPRSNRNLS